MTTDNPETQLMRSAAQAWMLAISAHHLQQREACDQLVAQIADGRATPFVLIEPGVETKCGYRIVGTDNLVVFARLPVTEPMPAWLN